MNNLTLRENEARSILKSQMSVLQTLTNKDEAKASIFASAILSQVTNKNLINCDLNSIIKNGIEIVRLGLNPNPNFGQAYIVSFKNTATLQIGYKGFISLGYRNGWIFRAVCVYSCDKFDIEFAGISDKIIFKPNFDERQDDNAKWIFDNLRGVIVFAKDNQNVEFSEFVSKQKLEKLRLTSPNQNDKTKLSGIWEQWSEEMYKAKALKYVATRLPITEQIQNAINAENEIYKNDYQKEKVSYSENPNNSQTTQNLDLNAIAEAEIITEQSEQVADEPKPKKAKKADIENAKDELKNVLFEKGLNEYEVIDFMSKKAYTPTLANQFLSDSKKLDFALNEFFQN